MSKYARGAREYMISDVVYHVSPLDINIPSEYGGLGRVARDAAVGCMTEILLALLSARMTH